MKLKHLHLKDFKQFKDFELDFTADGRSLDLITLIGENGVGKSTVLQAIAAVLATATGRLHHPHDLDWIGFEPERLAVTAEVRLQVEFTPEELQATHRYYNESDYSDRSESMPPDQYSLVDLVWSNQPNARGKPENAPVKAYTDGRSNRRAYFQFLGRKYAANMLKRGNREPDIFKPVGGVLWYTEQRLAASVISATTDEEFISTKRITDLRQLIAYWDARSSILGRKRLEDLTRIYSQLFPERKFSRVGDTFDMRQPPDIFSRMGHMSMN